MIDKRMDSSCVKPRSWEDSPGSISGCWLAHDFVIETQRERERERERHRERDTERETQRERHREIDTERETQR